MAVELAVGYVSIVPSTRGMAPALRGQMNAAALPAGRAAGATAGAAMAGGVAGQKGTFRGAGTSAGGAMAGGVGRALAPLETTGRNVGRSLGAGIGGGAKRAARPVGALGGDLRSMARMSGIFAGGMGLVSFAKSIGGVAAGATRTEASLSALYESAGHGAGEATKMTDLLFDSFGRSALPLETFQKGAETLAYLGMNAEESVGVMGFLEDAILATGGSTEEMGRVTEALTSAQNRGKATMQELNRISGAGIPILDMLSAAMGKTTGEIMSMASDGEISVDDLTQALQDVPGTWGPSLQEGADQVRKTLPVAWESAKNMVVNSIGQHLIPVVEGLAPIVTNVANGIARAFEFIGEHSEVFSRVAMVLGASIVPVLTGGIVKLTGALIGMGKGWLVALGPIGAVILAVGAVVAGLVWAYNNVEWFRDAVDAAWSWIKNAVEVVVDWFVTHAWPVLQQVWEGIVVGVKWLWEAITSYWSFIWDIVSTVVSWIVNNVWPVLKKVWDAITTDVGVLWGWFKDVWEGIREVAGSVVDWFMEHVHPVFESVAGLIMAVWDNLVIWWNRIWSGIREAWDIFGQPLADDIGVVFSWLGDLLGSWWGLMSEWWGALWSDIQTVWEKVGPPLIDTIILIWENLKTTFTTIWEVIKNVVETAMAIIRNVIDVVTGIISGDWSKVWDGIKGIAEAAWNMITNAVDIAINFVRGLISNVMDRINVNWSAVWNAIRTTVANIWDRIRTAISNAINTVRTNISNVFNTIRNTITNVVNTVRTTVANAFGRIRDLITTAVNGAGTAVSNAFNRIRTAVANVIVNLITTVRGLPGRIVSALGNLGRTLWNAGRNLIQGLIDGITSRIKAVTDTMSNVVSKVRDFLPFSPAKTGPLSGSGSPDVAGGKIVEMLADGLGNTVEVDKAMADLLSGLAEEQSADVLLSASTSGAHVPSGARSAAYNGVSGDSVQGDRPLVANLYDRDGTIIGRMEGVASQTYTRRRTAEAKGQARRHAAGRGR